MQDEMDEKYMQFLSKCDDAESKLFHFQNAIYKIKINQKQMIQSKTYQTT